eukprot:scaffold238112_cov30-Tisochrysis_lutea.AAC.1
MRRFCPLLAWLASAALGSGVDVAALVREGQELVATGNPAKAQLLYRDTLGKLGLSNEVAEARASLFEALAEAKSAQGKDADAVGAMEAAHEVLNDALGPNHAKVGSVLGRLADAHAAAGDHSSAANALGQLVAGMRAQNVGAMHPGFRHSLSKYAAALAAAGRRSDSIKVYKELIEMMTSLPPEHVGGEIAAAHVALATQVAQTANEKSLNEALGYAQLARRMHDDPNLHGDKSRLSGAEPLDAAIAANALSGILERLGRDEEAVEEMDLAYRLAVSVVGEDDQLAMHAQRNLEQLRRHIQRKAERGNTFNTGTGMKTDKRRRNKKEEQEKGEL